MLTSFLLVAACSDSNVGVTNNDPEVEITSPVEGQVLHASDAITFAALISDDLTANDDLGLAWGSTLQGPLEGMGSVNDIGAVLVVEGMEAGEHTVILQVVDSSSGSAEDRVDFTVEPNLPPTVTFLSPEAGATYGLGLSVHVQVLVEDDYLLDLTEMYLAWSGLEDLDEAPETPNADGTADFYVSGLDIGTYSLHVNAMDPALDSGSASVSFEVVEPDLDGDGFLDADLGGDDCNDGDAAIHPDADERCDGVDNDCDDEIDEGDAIDADLFYADDDGDGYGDESSPTTACVQPTDHIADGGDCDDTDPAVHPAAPEVCEVFDNDSDEVADENDAVDAGTWYEDADGDTYGTSAVATVSCDAPPGYVADGTDCDDDNAVVNPAEVETCNGVDDDCNGTADDGFDADADGVADCFDVEQCDNLDNDGDGDIDEDATDAGTWYADSDGDGHGDASDSTTACTMPSGYVAGSTDCDDDDATSYPGAAELCDGADNDCNGTVDDDATDATTWYYDGDGDGYGLTDTPYRACDQPAGYVADAADCDDPHPTFYPGADEYCDGHDDDCDGTIDEDTASDGSTWYDDADGEGYGDAAVSQVSCSEPSGTVTDSSDCDDTDASIHPGADEHCDGAVDEDCDGTVDETSAIDAQTWYQDADGDSYGNASSTTPACSEPSGYVGDDTDCDDSDATIHPGASETWYDGVDGDCDSGSDYDADGDGYDHSDYGGLDCDDSDASHYPGSTTWTVPGDASTIQDAVDLACTYDSIEVAAGTWTERLDFGDKELFLVGVDGSGSTTLDGDFYGDPALTLPGGTVEGFTITNGLALQGGAIRAEGGDWLELVDVVIDSNYASDKGGGVYVYGIDEVDLTDVEVTNNLGGSGAGIYLSSTGSITASNLVITDNETSGSGTYGGGLYLSTSSTTIDMPGLVLTGNSAYYGAGLYLSGSSLTADLSGAELTGNHATYRSGAFEVQVSSSSTVDLSGSDFSGNSAANYYGTGYAYAGSTTEIDLSGSSMDGGESGDHYAVGEFYASSYSAIDLSGVSMTGNTVRSSYVLYVGSDGYSEVDLTDVVLSDNTCGGSYPGGYLRASSHSDLILDGLEVSNNRGSSSYPGIYLSISDYSTVSASGLSVVGNQTSSSSTYALHVYTTGGGTFDAENLLVAGNSGPGVYLYTTSTSDAASLTNATIVGNGGTGLLVDPVWVRQVDLVNVISAYNEGYGISNDSGTYEPGISYTDVYGNDNADYDDIDDPTGSDGNVSVDPEFLVFAAAASADLWDLHLAAGSPLEDAGDPGLHDPDGTTSDIGAYGGPGGESGYADDDDGDGMADGWEDAHGLDSTTDDAADDLDGDGLSNIDEYNEGSDPESPWTDQDVWSDGDEVSNGTDPLVTDDSMSAWIRGPSGYAAGYSLALPGDVDGDGIDDVLVGSWGYAWLLSGPVITDVDLSTTYTTQFTGSYAGYGVGGVGDLDGDGYADVALGAYPASSRGEVYLFFGPTASSESTGSPDATWTGESSDDQAGRRLAPAGDQDGDGVRDVFIGAPYQDDGASNGGGVYLVSGAATGTDSLTGALARRVHTEENTYASMYGLAGDLDLDGDGQPDLATSATYSSLGHSSGGVVFVEFGPITGSANLSDADVLIAPTGSSDYYFGWGVQPGGDIDGDGSEDLLACMYGEQNYAGATYVLAGPLSGDGTPAELALGKLIGEDSYDYACAAAGAGDLDGDGYGDLVIGSHENDSGGSNAGAAYVVLGPVTGSTSLANARVKQVGDDSEDYFGRNVTGGSDVDGDGRPDVVISNDYDDTNGSYSGGAGVLLGSSF